MGLIRHLFKLIKLSAIIVAVGVCFALYLWIPSYSGEIIHHRQYGTINIYRDEHAIPHVVGENLDTVLYGLGYSHCQDRLWNMDIYRRIASGRMSELFGNATLETDILMREFGINRAGKTYQKLISKGVIANIQAYADGINDCADAMKILPLEYYITGNSFTKWEVLDSLYFNKLLNFQLTSDWPYELIREKLIKIYGKAAAEQMMGNRNLFDNTTIMNEEELKIMGLYKHFEPNSNSTSEQAGSSLTAKQLELIMKTGILDYLSENKGSNGWVIHGNHTTTGKPIIANDPHLDNQVPTIWAQAVLHFKTNSGKDQTVSGGSMPGTAAIMSGMTNYFAWSMTTLYTDTSDLYQEQLNDDGTQYFLDNKWYDLKIVVEPIHIKGNAPYNLTVKSTHRGPILQRDSMNISLTWIGNVENDRTCDGIFNFYQLDNYDELIKSLNILDGPTQALTFATIDNRIGFYGMGRHPIRSKPNQGSYIQDGTKTENDWIRFNTQEEQPRLYDPPKGYIVTANNKFGSDNTLNTLSLSVATTARARRINQIIEQYIRNGTKISPEDVKNMQRDVMDSFAEKIHPHYISLYHENKNSILTQEQITLCDKMMAQLEKWDFFVEEDSVGASIYYAIDFFLGKKLLPQYSEDENVRYKVTYHFIFDHFRLNSIKDWSEGKNINELWCQNIKSNVADKHCIYNFVSSVLDAYQFLAEKLGNNVNKWFYGEIHRHHFIHFPFSKSPLKFLFERSFPSKGSKYTVHVSTKNFNEGSWNGIWGGNYKSVVSLDLNNSDSFYIIDTGISGNLLSSHYDDQMQIYKQGGYLKQNRNVSTYSHYQNLTLIKNPYQQSNKKQDI